MSKPIEIGGFSGINKNHDRGIGQFSGGKNFRTKAGKFRSRGGSTTATTPVPCTSIKSLHAAAKVSADTRLLLEEGTNLWHKTTGAWTTVKTDLNGTRLGSARWQDFLLLGNGNQMLAYDITARTIAALGGGAPPMQNFVNWKFRPFGWAPDFANPHLLSYAGYDALANISKDVWPANYAINIGGDAGQPILNCIPRRTHLMCFTRNFFKRVYGEDETNFSILDGADIGLYDSRLAVLVDDVAIWAGSDKKVYLDSGSSPVPISKPIDELLETEDFSGSFMLNLQNQAWLFFPSSTTTKVYIFDLVEGQWYIDIYPGVVTAAYSHGAYNSQEYTYFGTSAGTMLKLDDTQTTDSGAPIITEGVLGPIDFGGAELWLNNLHVNCEPRNNFALSIYPTCDRRAEQGPFTGQFTTGTQQIKEIPLQQVRGYNVSLKLSSTDHINELQKITLMSGSWGVK